MMQMSLMSLMSDDAMSHRTEMDSQSSKNTFVVEKEERWGGIGVWD